MKRIYILFALSLTFLSVGACSREQPPYEVKTAPEGSVRKGNNPETGRLSRETADLQTPDGASRSGTVVETMNAAGYTYVQVDTGSEKIWAAAPEFQVKVGDRVVVPEGAPMQNYHSKTLDRDFAVVYFVGSILNETDGAPSKGHGMPAGHPPAAARPAPPQIDVGAVEKAEGGITIGELYAEKATLSGKEVTLRGKVVKFNAQIMGKNWLHVRDGSGDADAHTNDLTVNTATAVKVGDTVLVSGKVILDKDFGSGYKYDVIIEDAKVTPE